MNGIPGLTSKPADKAEEVKEEVKEEVAAPTVSDEDREYNFTSHPIMNFAIGGFKFENGLHTVKGKHARDRFVKFLSTLPPSERARIKELDVDAAEAIAREFIAKNGGATKTIDSSIGERAQNNQVGQGKLEDSQKA